MRSRYTARPTRNPARRLASFEGWSDTVRSALIWLGGADPVATMERAREEDPELSTLSALLTSWSSRIGVGWQNRRTAAAVVQLAEEQTTGKFDCPDLHDAIAAIATNNRGRIDATRLGYWLREKKHRVVGGLRITVEPKGHAAEWYVEEVQIAG